MLQTEQRIIQVYPLWQRGQLLLGCGPMTLDCNNNLLGTLRRAWLVPSDCEGGKDYNLVFAQPDPNIQNVMTGIWMQTSDGEGIVLNANSIEDIVSACDSCCGNSPLVPLEYSPATPILPPVQVLPSTYSFTRTDNGSNYAKSIAEMDYYGQYIPGTFLWRSHVGTQTRYEFKSRKMPALIGTDVYSGGGTYYKKVSNEAPPKATDDLYSLMVYSTYYGNSGPWLGKTLADIVYQLQTIGGFTTDVAVSTEQNRIMALTIQNNLSFVLGVQSIEGTVILSNPAVPPASGNLYQLNIVAAGFNSRDSLFGTALQGGGSDTSIIDGKQIFPDWQQATLWVENGNQLAFSSPGVNTATLTLLTNVAPIGRLFVSNIVAVLLPGNDYQLTFKYTSDSGPNTDTSIKGATMAALAAQANITYPDNRIGTWTAQADTISVTTKVNNIYNIYLQIDQIAVPLFISNPAPAVPAGQHLSMTGVFDSVDKYPILSGATAADLVALLTTSAPWSAFGAWSVVPTNKIQLASDIFTTVTLTLYASNVFFTNPAPTLTAGKIFQLSVHTGGISLIPNVVGATLAEVVANVPTTGEYAPVGGTWAVSGTQITLTGSTLTDVYLLLDIVTEPVIISNVAPAITAGHRLTFISLLDSAQQYPMLTSNTAPNLVIATIPPYSTYGTWSYPGGNKVQLDTTKFSGGTFSLADDNFVLTQSVTPLAAGQVYQIRVNLDGAFLPVDVIGETLADLVANLPTMIPAYDPAVTGTWAVQVDAIRITSAFPAATNFYVLLQTMAAPVFLSNVIAAIPAGNHVNLQLKVGTDVIYSNVSSATVAALITTLSSFAPFNTMGTWVAVGANQIQLTATRYNPMTLTLQVTSAFYSNASPTLTGGNVYRLTGYVNNTVISPTILGATLAVIVAAIPGSSTWAALGGSWTVGGAGNDQVLLTSTTESNVYLVLDQIAPPVFQSNVAPAVTSGEHLSDTVTIGTEIIYPILSAGDVTFLRSRIASTVPYSTMGTWSVVANKLQLVGAKYDPITLVLASSNVYITNPAPTLTGGEVYQLEVFWNTTFITPNVRAATLAEIVANIPVWGDWVTIGGTWAVSGTQITLTGSTQNGVWIRLIATANPAILSNVAPAVPAGEHLNLIANIVNIAYYPYLASATLTGLLGFLNSTVPYTSFGTWSIVGGDKLQLTDPHYDGLTLVINAGNVFYSNVAPTLIAGQQFKLRLWHNTAFITPDVFGATISSVVLAIPTTGDWATVKDAGTWGIVNNEVTLTGSAQTEIYMLLEAVPTPFEADSNSAPVLTSGDQYVFTATLDSVEVAPTITATTLPDLLSGILGDANYTDKGSWSIDTDKIHLISATVTTATLVITTETIPAFAPKTMGSAEKSMASEKRSVKTSINKLLGKDKKK